MILDLFSVKDKVAVVTGGGRGIGAATAVALAEAGADVVISSRTESDLAAVAKQVEEIGRRAVVVPADLSELDAVADLTHRIHEDLAYDQAATSVSTPVDEVPAGRIWIGRDAEQIRLLDIAVLPEFQNRGAGTLLLGALINEAKAEKKPLRHMVFMLNNDAHRFYERLGFVVIEDLGAYKHMEWCL